MSYIPRTDDSISSSYSSDALDAASASTVSGGGYNAQAAALSPQNAGGYAEQATQQRPDSPSTAPLTSTADTILADFTVEYVTKKHLVSVVVHVGKQTFPMSLDEWSAKRLGLVEVLNGQHGPVENAEVAFSHASRLWHEFNAMIADSPATMWFSQMAGGNVIGLPDISVRQDANHAIAAVRSAVAEQSFGSLRVGLISAESAINRLIEGVNAYSAAIEAGSPRMVTGLSLYAGASAAFLSVLGGAALTGVAGITAIEAGTAASSGITLTQGVIAGAGDRLAGGNKPMSQILSEIGYDVVLSAITAGMADKLSGVVAPYVAAKLAPLIGQVESHILADILGGSLSEGFQTAMIDIGKASLGDEEVTLASFAKNVASSLAGGAVGGGASGD